MPHAHDPVCRSRLFQRNGRDQRPLSHSKEARPLSLFDVNVNRQRQPSRDIHAVAEEEK